MVLDANRCRLCWYVGDKYLKDLKSHSELSERVMEGILSLADFLVSEVRILERGSEQSKKEVKEQIPADRVKDAPALARELRWRARLALGHSSSDEQDNSTNGVKRKRSASEAAVPSIFRNFRPKTWDDISEAIEVTDTKRLKCKAAKPDGGEGWAKTWLEMGEADAEEGNAEDAFAVKSRKERCIKVRRTNNGVERQRIERTVESWEWQ